MVAGSNLLLQTSPSHILKAVAFERLINVSYSTTEGCGGVERRQFLWCHFTLSGSNRKGITVKEGRTFKKQVILYVLLKKKKESQKHDSSQAGIASYLGVVC